MTSGGYSRKKQPEVVRRTILNEAARIAVEQGLAGVTVQAVADAAGITKGGVFHHFSSKQALIEGMFNDVLEKLDAEIDRHMAQDPEPHGRFTRAYVETLLVGERFGVGSPFDALSVTMIAEPSLGTLWIRWMSDRMVRHNDTDNDALLEIVRFAVDGAWLAYLGKNEPRNKLELLRERLLAMTRKPSPDSA